MSLEAIERDELQSIKRRAREHECCTVNQGWIRAYADLAAACNHLDAIMARQEAAAVAEEEDEDESDMRWVCCSAPADGPHAGHCGKPIDQ